MVNQRAVLVVDDEDDVLHVIRSGLLRYGHKVDSFSDPVIALEHFRKNFSSYDLVLSDIRMPGMNGLEFARRIKEFAPRIDILMMTAFEINQYELSKELPFVRAEDLLRKPFMLSKICQIIDSYSVKLKNNRKSAWEY